MHVRRLLLYARRHLDVRGCVVQGDVMIPPDGFEIVNDLGKLRARSGLSLPTLSNDLSEVLRPWVTVRDFWPSVILCEKQMVGNE
jgi:hypothetical protein